MKMPNLSRKLMLEIQSRSPDGAGGFVVAWQELGMLWAEVTASSGREAIEGGLRRSSRRWKIVVRAAPVGSARRPTSSQRFRDGDRVFLIHSVAEADTSGRFLTCDASEEHLS